MPSRSSDAIMESGEDRKYEEYSALLDSVRGLRWPARHAVRGGVPGAHTSRLRGSAAEFMEYRPYRQGDDPARIDWKLFARSDRAYIRLSTDRAILATTIVMDSSASMGFPAESVRKWRLAAQIAIGLATVARNSGDPVGLLIPHPRQPVRVAPGTRRSVLHELMRGITATTPQGSESLAPSISAAIRAAGRVVVISDFLGDADEMLSAAAAAVAASREVHAVHIVAREELEPVQDAAMVGDPEHPEIRRPLTSDSRLRYQKTFATWRETLAQEWIDAGIAFHTAVTEDHPPDHIIRQLVAPCTEWAPG